MNVLFSFPQITSGYLGQPEETSSSPGAFSSPSPPSLTDLDPSKIPKRPISNLKPVPHATQKDFSKSQKLGSLFPEPEYVVTDGLAAASATNPSDTNPSVTNPSVANPSVANSLVTNQSSSKSNAPSSGNHNSAATVRKCRALYGPEQKDRWCKPCKNKKKCVQFL